MNHISDLTDDDRQSRLANRRAMEAMGLELFPAKAFKPSHKVRDLSILYMEHADLPENERPILRIAGRLTAHRHVGSIWFADLMQEHATVQLRVKVDAVPPELWGILRHLDVNDIIGVDGFLIQTTRGQLTVDVRALYVLCKAATSAGLGKLSADGTRHGARADRGALLRKNRHVELLTNPSLTENLRAHATVLSVFRRIMEQEGFLELQTSILGPYYGGAAATPFTTQARGSKGQELYLRVSPEPDLKRALAGGLEKVYEIGRNFRNEGIDHTHQPSFTAFECYAAWQDYEDMMRLTEQLIVSSVEAVCGHARARINGKVIDFEGPWPRLRMLDLVARELGLTAKDVTFEALNGAWLERNPGADASERPTSWGELLTAIFEDEVEDKLIGPCFVIDHPVETSPLTKVHRDDPRLTERFEAYVGGMEIANAYSELNDPLEQRRRLEMQDLVRDDPYGVDEFFLSAIDDGMPQAGGLGIGIDRIVMVITGAKRISDVVPFPLS